jgi:hypothetical protein
MSKRAKERNKTIGTDDQTIRVQAWVPDYEHACENCGERPVVTGVRDGHVIIATGMCGACTWGDHDAVDPAVW